MSEPTLRSCVDLFRDAINEEVRVPIMYSDRTCICILIIHLFNIRVVRSKIFNRKIVICLNYFI